MKTLKRSNHGFAFFCFNKKNVLNIKIYAYIKLLLLLFFFCGENITIIAITLKRNIMYNLMRLSNTFVMHEPIIRDLFKMENDTIHRC